MYITEDDLNVLNRAKYGQGTYFTRNHQRYYLQIMYFTVRENGLLHFPGISLYRSGLEIAICSYTV